MKRTVLFLITLFCINFTFCQSLNSVVTDEKGTKTLLGQVDKNGLTQAPFNDWFNKNHSTYLENDKVVKAFKNDLKDYKIKAFFGSWCGDSKRELPRFYKILEEANYPMNQLEVIAVDRTDEAYKQAPNGEEKGLNIHRVPTFIFYKDGKEVNRIVEHPKETLERDMYKIIAGEKYAPNYQAVTYLDSLLSEKSLEELREDQENLANKLADYVDGRWELNTYGYVLLRAKHIEKAIYVFETNIMIYPYKHHVYDSLGEAYFEAENYPEALKNYYKVLSMDPENKNAKEMIEKISTKV